MPEISDPELLKLVVDTDTELFKAGVSIRGRDLKVITAVMEKLGYRGFVLFGSVRPPVLDKIEAMFRTLYRKQDLAMGGHIGVFMYRDVFARVGVPHIYGQRAINPFDYLELTNLQKQVLGGEPDEIESYLDQFADIADVQYGINELRPEFAKQELVKRFINLSRLHLHAAAAVLTGGYDFRGAVQSGLLATELALKAAAGAQGLSEEVIRDRFSHDFRKLADFVSSSWPSFDGDRVQRTVRKQPRYVPNRYSEAQPDRREVGHIVMGAQFIASEVVRQLSNRNFRVDLERHTRFYPA